ncbi:MAG: TIGR02300 family protein [Alphaproteobacteria bacterium]|nr:TIGR02300 family protein [Alphaproteobacteria bacterium]
MVDPKLGTKRVCEACGAKFYDLNKSPAVCPKCGHVYDPTLRRRLKKKKPMMTR